MAPQKEGTAFVLFVGDLGAILHRRRHVRVIVEVREDADGSLSIFHGPRRLADYTADGTLVSREAAQQSAA